MGYLILWGWSVNTDYTEDRGHTGSVNSLGSTFLYHVHNDFPMIYANLYITLFLYSWQPISSLLHREDRRLNVDKSPILCDAVSSESDQTQNNANSDVFSTKKHPHLTHWIQWFVFSQAFLNIHVYFPMPKVLKQWITRKRTVFDYRNLYIT